jgi:hypothetical protein
MKKIILLSIGVFLLTSSKSQINLNKLKKTVTGKDTATANVINAATQTITGTHKGNLSNDEVISGLKEALTIGTQNSSKKLGTVDGFFKDAALKILMPPEAEKVTNTLRSMGMGSLVDKAILSLSLIHI